MGILKRARTKSGHYVADDPSTPENEAWVEEKPKKKKGIELDLKLNRQTT